MAEAMAVGIRSIKALTGRKAAVMRIRTAVRKKAPTACSIEMPDEAPIKAAPGVDHAAIIGMRCRMLRIAVVAIIETQSAAIQDEVCSGLAPTAFAAARTMATDPPNPTSTATTAEMTTDARIIHPEQFRAI